MEHELGDAPIEDRYNDMMLALARMLDNFFNHGVTGPDRETGFILMVFPFNIRDGRCNYMSNGANRRDVVRLMKEQIKRFEANFDEKLDA